MNDTTALEHIRRTLEELGGSAWSEASPQQIAQAVDTLLRDLRTKELSPPLHNSRLWQRDLEPDEYFDT